jgi:threonine/homoserine/homoserine lactone efflux protein
MSIYEAVGMAWVIFSSALATVGVLYLAFIGLRVTLDRAQEAKETDVPVEVKEMFKVAR